MTDSTQQFISELRRAVNEIDLLTKPERAGLLRRAAVTIRDYQDQINNLSIGEEVAEIILKCRLLQEAKQELEE
ncbi:hypothetical protein ABFT80_27025 [Mesorhizobium sp. SB112]|uniref:hypothetical protein n=1 Tax=Mesorhizobium sp. SB112 TaxID=3151853 RepID=UPI0032669D5C